MNTRALPNEGGSSTELAGPLQLALDAIVAAELFQDVSADTLALLAAEAVRRDYPLGQVIFRQGETGDEMLVIAEGTVKVLATRRGGEVPLATLGAGDCVGEMAVLTGEPRSATVHAGTVVAAYALGGAAFRAAVREDPALAER